MNLYCFNKEATFSYFHVMDMISAQCNKSNLKQVNSPLENFKEP